MWVEKAIEIEESTIVDMKSLKWKKSSMGEVTAKYMEREREYTSRTMEEQWEISERER